MLQNGKILLQRDQNGDAYALPGGHVKIGETTEQALVREYKEETSADITCKRLLWTEECFWEWNGAKAHTICFYYLVESCGDRLLPDDDVFLPHRDNPEVVYGWIPVEQIADIVVYPTFLKEEIHHLCEYPKHFVTREG